MVKKALFSRIVVSIIIFCIVERNVFSISGILSYFFWIIVVLIGIVVYFPEIVVIGFVLSIVVVIFVLIGIVIFIKGNVVSIIGI